MDDQQRVTIPNQSAPEKSASLPDLSAFVGDVASQHKQQSKVLNEYKTLASLCTAAWYPSIKISIMANATQRQSSASHMRRQSRRQTVVVPKEKTKKSCYCNRTAVIVTIVVVIIALGAGVGIGFVLFPMIISNAASSDASSGAPDLDIQSEDLGTDEYLVTMETMTVPEGDIIGIDDINCGKLRSVTFNAQEKRFSRIVGGEGTYIERYPWQVSMWANNRHTCGGSIIASNWILSAAHCTAEYPNPENWTVYAGSSTLMNMQSNVSKIAHPTLVLTHEEFDSVTFDNDVALLRLDRHLKRDATIATICLSPRTTVLQPGRECSISGWGTLKEGGSVPDRLQQATVLIMDREKCNQDDWLMDMVSELMICAGTEDGSLDACQGDSGGPLTCLSTTGDQYFLAGAVSWGIGCGVPKWPGVYTNLPKYHTWISDMVQKY